mgnify:FL=1
MTPRQTPSPAVEATGRTPAVTGDREPETDPLILRTKLHRPQLASDYVARQRLLDRMDRVMEMPLNLISAPAGAGKSVVAAAWLESRSIRSMWLSLDGADSDLSRFLAYLVAGLEDSFPGHFDAFASLLGAPELPPVSTIATFLINDFDRMGAPSVLVLDDYHVLEKTSPVHELVTLLLEHAPPNLHLVLCSRVDPPLPLAKMRAGNRINDLQLSDLKFTRQESGELLKKIAEHDFTEDAVNRINTSVEGWAVGLRLAALAARAAPDRELFLDQLDSGLPDLTSYLMDEVLAALPAELRGYIVKAAVLDRFCPALLEFMQQDGETDSSPRIDGKRLIEFLERNNLFVVQLDSKRQWFRFHRLFQELLLQSLCDVCGPADIRALRLRAASWYEQHHYIGDAVTEMLAAQDFEAAADCVERRLNAILDQNRSLEVEMDQWRQLKAWLRMLPDGVIERRIALLVAQGWIAHFELRVDEMARTIAAIEADLAERTANPKVLAYYGFLRAILLYWDGKSAESIQAYADAAASFPARPSAIAGEARCYLAMAQQMNGDTDLALRSLTSDLKRWDGRSSLYASRLIGGLAIVHLLSGDLGSAAKTGRKLIRAISVDDVLLQLWGRLLVGIASFHAYRFDDAIREFTKIADNRYFIEKRASLDAMAGLALCHAMQGNSDRAEASVDELLGFANEGWAEEHLQAAESCRARVALLRGDSVSALGWARSFDAEIPPQHLTVWLAAPTITRLRILLLAGDQEEIATCGQRLDQLRAQLDALNVINHSIDVAVLQALAAQKFEGHESARQKMQEALNLAAPGGWIRPFAELGDACLDTLSDVAGLGTHRAFIAKVLKSCARTGRATQRRQDQARGSAVPRVALHAGRDNLTNREADILELLAQRLRNKEIAAHLNVSTNTVKDHLKHIYQKLNVTNRREAVSKAMTTGILKN